MANRVKLVPTIGAEIPNHDFTVMVGATPAQSAQITDSDNGKACKMASGAPDSRVVFCADGDEIHGQLVSVEGLMTSAGYKVGTMRFASSPLFDAQVAAGAAPLAVGDEVVAADQAAPGVPNNPAPYHVRMLVRKADTPNGRRLKVAAIQSGNGGPGSVLTLTKMF